MSVGLQAILNDDGVFEEYDDTYDLTIHCESGEEQEEVLNKLNCRWIPVSERVADFPCLACDIYEQIFIPFGVVTINNRCFDGKDFEFDVEKFLKGKEVTLFSGEKVYELPREIVAWMPLPQPYEPQEREVQE